jgi:hypothetical protein
MQTVINWFEIFVTDVKRAQGFYERMLDAPMKAETFNGEPHAIFRMDGVSGALVERKGRGPSREGALVYLNCTGKLDGVLSRVEQAGGKVVMPKTDLGPPGFIAIVTDTEGNQVGLHAER